MSVSYVLAEPKIGDLVWVAANVVRDGGGQQTFYVPVEVFSATETPAGRLEFEVLMPDQSLLLVARSAVFVKRVDGF